MNILLIGYARSNKLFVPVTTEFLAISHSSEVETQSFSNEKYHAIFSNLIIDGSFLSFSGGILSGYIMRKTYYLGKDVRSFLTGFLTTSNSDRPNLKSRSNVYACLSNTLEPILDIHDIQGNILAGFNKNHQALLFLEIRNTAAAQKWINVLEPKISRLEEVLLFKRLYQTISSRLGTSTCIVESIWLNIAFSFQGLQKLVRGNLEFDDDAFRKGMHNRSSILGDPIEKDSPGHCHNWLIGSPSKLPDIVLIVASDREDNLSYEVEKIKSGLGEGLKLMFTQLGEALPEPFQAHEHFGFRDGISQPGVRGLVSDNPNDYLTLREYPNNPNQGKPGQELIWPGEFVFGYPRQDPTDPIRPGPVADAGPTWARNGSLLVFRRLRQDVEGFRNFLQTAAKELAKNNPELASVTPDILGAKLLGRWPSGTPILSAPESDNTSIAENSKIINDFDFSKDALGLVCPHAAHIRKVNPRDDLENIAEVQTHRLIRRGIPYGKPYPAPDDKGLLFLAYQTSIERQFEFITRSWMNNPDFLDNGDGYDPISGQNRRLGENRFRTFTIPVRKANGSIEKISIDLPNDWVIPTGGGYFFAPSISALKYLAEN